jgi:hypothetical protein
MSMFIKHTLIGTLLILFVMIVFGCAITHIPEPPVYDPVVFETGETVAVNNDGWKLKKYSRKLESGHEVISYEMWDPVLKRWYPAVAYQDGEVIMSDHGKELWRKDRMALPKEKRFEALPEKPEVERDEEIDIGGACFDPKTRVLVADGGLQEISDIKEGQLVKSYNIEKGTVDDRSVTKTYMFRTEGYYLINGELKATAKHKFLMAGDENIWKKAYELKPGDMVKSLEGKIIIRSVQNLIEKDTSHNFLVADTKAYIVKGGNNYYVVHNGL